MNEVRFESPIKPEDELFLEFVFTEPSANLWDIELFAKLVADAIIPGNATPSRRFYDDRKREP